MVKAELRMQNDLTEEAFKIMEEARKRWITSFQATLSRKCGGAAFP